MKIVRVGIENLNSLYGEHQVDFEQDLGDAPLFLIIGPTGAGKSTLLDAICLALFGQTPRLPSRRQAVGSDLGLPADDCRRIMSEGTAHCRAEVEFTKVEPGGSGRYRAIWTCQRARRKAGGNLQPAERTLERWDSAIERWTLLGGGRQQKHFNDAFHQALEGLEVEDFKRSVLLAQGDFAALLQADRRHRADLLERLTGTDIYQRIGQIAAQRRGAAQKALDEADITLGAAHLLPGEDVARLQADRTALEQETRDLVALLAARRQRIEWYRTSQKLAEDLTRARELVADAERELAGAAPELARLAEHERCAPAARALQGVERIEDEQRPIAELLPGLCEVAQRKAEMAEAAQRAVTAAEAIRVEQNSVLEQARPVIARARTLRATVAERRADLAHASAERDERQRNETGALTALESLRARRQEVSSEIDTLRVELATVGEGARLAGAMPGIEHSLVTRADLHARLESMRVELSVLSGGRELAREASEALAELERWTDRRERAEKALRDRAEDLPGERRRIADEIERVKEQTALRVRASLAWTAVAEQEAKVTQQRLELGQAECELATANAEFDRLSARENLVHFARARRALVPGTPCPVCGSASHPAALVALEPDDIDETALARARQRLEAATGSLASARTRLEDWEHGAERALRDLAVLLAELDLPLDSGLADLDEVGRSVDQLGSELEQRREALEAADAAVRRATAEERHAREACEVAARRLQVFRELAGDIAHGAAEVERIETNLLAQLAVEATARDLDQAVAGARIVAARWRAATDAVSRLERASQELALEVGKCESRLDLAGREARKAEQLAEQTAEVLAKAEANAREVLAAIEDLDVHETGLELVVSRAMAELEVRRTTAEQARVAAARADTERGNAQKQQAGLSARLGEMRVALSAQLAELGLDGEPALRARLSEDPELSLLRQRRIEVENAWKTAEVELRAREDSLLAHQALRVPDAPTDAAGLASEEQAREADEHRLTERHQKLGAVQNQLAQHAADLERHAKAAAIRDDRARDRDRWNRLHQLVGVGDGAKFQEFAQILNLEDLVRRANSHLENLAPRYSLVPARDSDGEPTLDFAVRDDYQAGTERPIKTLSGGETFLVSLALALGLASYHEVRMPIETLLLDEGFGTLDRETLDIAIGALEQLHSGGTHVGIISHVEALRERVEARILVERLGNGRSRLKVEVG